MQRREFNLATTAAAILTGCGGGGGGEGGVPATSTAPGTTPPSVPAPGPGATPAPTAPPATPAPTAPPSHAPTPAPAPVPASFAIGTNIASMELAPTSGLRFGGSTLPNVNYTVPRSEDIAWLAANGYRKTRLPVRWEMLQPVLNTSSPNAATRALLGNPGEFHPGYAGYITQVLDAHAAAGMKCIIDCHNYCRYTDFVYQADGSVVGLTNPNNPLLMPYTTDSKQVQVRIMALAAGATLTQSNYNDFWTRVAAKWKDHPGFGGYGMMNEPYYMPKPGTTVEAFEGWGEDLTIWPTFAKAAIAAIRAVDPNGAIYLGGNDWNSAWTLGTNNPGFPVDAANVVYDVHGYLDSFSNGNGVDWDLEVQKGFTAGVAAAPIDEQTGVNRLQQAVQWAQAQGARVALTETGMPLDDARWQMSFTNLLNYARDHGVEVFSWAGGSHWIYRNRAINHMPGWHQNKTLEPSQSGPMKGALGVAKATVFDDGGGWAPAGGSVTVVVYARGWLAAPVTISVASNNGGSFDKTTLTLPAGANTQDQFTFTPPPNAVVTLSYSSASAPNLPPPRKVYSLSDPVAYAATNLPDAARAIMAKYSACKWEMADAATDYVQGAAAAEGQAVRAVSDSGWGSSVGNAMEMIVGINTQGGTAMTTMGLPVLRTLNGHRSADFSAANSIGFWCRKSWVVPGLQPNPRNRVPYNLTDPHFVIAAASVPGANSGVVFQASSDDGAFVTEIDFAGGRPQGKWVDSAGNSVVLTSPAALAANVPAVVTITSTAGAQQMRVNSAVTGSGASTFAASLYGNNQMLLGWGFISEFPRDSFGGNLFSVVTGKGVPSAAELQVLERYVGTTAGI